jgi:hypothetical protein
VFHNGGTFRQAIAMNPQNLRIVLAFSTEDQAWLRRSQMAVPDFWSGHTVAPALGDVLRVGGRQFEVHARVWEHDGTQPVLRLFLADGRAQSDTAFGQ